MHLGGGEEDGGGKQTAAVESAGQEVIALHFYQTRNGSALAEPFCNAITEPARSDKIRSVLSECDIITHKETSMQSRDRTVTIIGAGLAGLAAAYDLQR